ncbi:MAG: helix-turn-helix domain-containing protein [Methylococcaceae bacterium]
MSTQTLTLQDIINRLDILTSAVLSNKQTLSIEEASAFTNLTVSYLYKLTSTQEIPHYKPRGKMLYFDRSELESWLKQGKVQTLEALDNKATCHIGGVK